MRSNHREGGVPLACDLAEGNASLVWEYGLCRDKGTRTIGGSQNHGPAMARLGDLAEISVSDQKET